MTKSVKNIALTFLIGVVVFIIGNLIEGGFDFENTGEFFTEFAFYQLYSFVLGYSNMYFFDYLEKINWKPGKINIKRIVVGITGSVIITMVMIFFLRMFISTIIYGQSLEKFLTNQKFEHYSFGLWITLTIVLIFHFIYFYNRYQKNKVKESQIVAKTETAKFESLKNQLDPHFLFNSLNVLTSLIGENPHQAERFTAKLSKVYRYVLEQKDKDLIPLEEELKFAKSYMELLKMRFEDGINFSIPETVSSSELKIVPLSLQLLLENAVKHNVITSSNPLEIRIYEEYGYLVVENNINPKASLGKSTKVGLKNINQRYSLITNNKVEIENNNKVFKVKLPLLTQEIKVMRTDFMNNDSQKYIRARKRVDDLKGFYGNLASYCVVIPFLIFINYQTSWHFKWFYFPMFGWGLGLAVHAFTLFGYGQNWEERKIREFMEKDKNNF